MLTRENKVEIIGTLESNNLVQDNKVGLGPYVRGTLVIKVSSPKQMSIPVSYFATIETKDKKPRKLYTQLMGLKQGQKISISASIQDNKFWDTTRGQLVKTKRLNIVYINNVKSEDLDKADFTFSGFVAETLKEAYSKGERPELIGYRIKVAQSNYDESRAEVIEFTVGINNAQARNYIQKEYNVNKTVKVSGQLDYNIITETVEEAQDFGAPIVKTYQRNISNLEITGGVSVSEGVYEKADIDRLLNADQVNDRDVEAKAKTSEKSGATQSTNKPQVAGTGTNQSLI